VKILCALDGSPGSEKTVQALAEHAWPPGTIIRILSVAEKVHPSVVELVATGESPADAQRGLDFRCRETAELAASKLQAAGMTCESASLEGDPKSVIVEEARRWSANLIVVGHRGRSGIARLLLGSVAQSVVAHAHCSVLVIRRGEDTSG
jgi:nucleotide-binding universal stress UspA family protein